MASGDELPEFGCENDEPLPAAQTVSFLHAVGQSTIRQGLTVPVIAQIAWLSEIQKGQNVPVTVRFAADQSVSASLRRLNNAKGHLQFRYETRHQAALRDYLAAVFHGNTGPTNAVLRVIEIEPRVFSFDVITTGHRHPAVLSLCNPHFHNCSKDAVEAIAEFKELIRCLISIPYDENVNQAEYNKRIASGLSQMGWATETRISDSTFTLFRAS